MKNDPGNYYNFVLVDASTKTFMYKQGAANLGNVPQLNICAVFDHFYCFTSLRTFSQNF